MAIFDRKDCFFSFVLCYNDVALEPNDYIEYVFLKNFLIDLALISLTHLLLKRKGKWRCSLLGALFGGAFGCVYALFDYPLIVDFSLKTISGIVLCLISSNTKSLRGNLRFLACFASCSCFFAGLTALLPYRVWGIPVMSVILFLFCLTIERMFYRRRAITSFSYPCKACFRGHELSLHGYLDSGNRVTFRGEPVCILFAKVITKFLSADEPIKAIGKISITTVNGSREILLLEFDSLTVYSASNVHTIKKVKVGLSPNKLSDDYEILLHPSLIEEDYDS